MGEFTEHKLKELLEYLYKRKDMWGFFYGEPTARDIAKKVLTELSMKTIYTHLNRLEAEELILKKENSGADTWRITDRGVELMKLLQEEYKTEKVRVERKHAEKFAE